MVGSDSTISSFSKPTSSTSLTCSVAPPKPPNDSGDQFDSFISDEPFNDASDDSVISVSEQSSRPPSSTPVSSVEGAELTDTSVRSGRSAFEAGSRRERHKASVKNNKDRAKEQAKQALEYERLGSESWTPELVCPIQHEIGQLYRFRLICERLCRAHTAHHGIQQGVQIHQTVQQVTVTCLGSFFNAFLRFNWLPSSGQYV